MSRTVLIAALAACLALGGWYVLSSSQTQSTLASAADALVPPANAQEASDIDTSTIAEMQLGNPDAPVTVIEYASYTCPHCATFHTGAYQQLKADYIDTGKINFIYREVYFDRFGLWASAIARCAGTPESFFGITDMLYKSQQEWARAGEPSAIVDALRRLGRLAGLENDALEACLQDQDKLRTLVAWYQQNAEEHGVRSTPTFVINGKTHSNMPYSEMSALIDEAAGG